MHARSPLNGLTPKKILQRFFLRGNNTDFPSHTGQVSSLIILSFSILCFLLDLEENTLNFTPIKCRTEVDMVVLAEEAMVVQTGVIRMGTVTIKTTSPLATPVLETILQPIPTGMNILGLELKSKFAWRLFIL